MPDIITSQIFSNGEKGITATKMNNIVGGSVIQPDFYNGKPSSPTLDPTDQLLELKGTGAYARITGSQLINSVGSQLAAATFVTKTAAYTLTAVDSGKYIICSGGSWILTLPAPSSGLNYRLRNDMGISGTTGTITLQPNGGTINGLASIPLLPQQECTLITDGTNWRTFGLRREVILGTQDTITATASAVILLPVGYRYFELELDQIAVDTNGSYIYFQLSANGGSTWSAGATDYREGTVYDGAATTASYSDATTSNGVLAAPQATLATNVGGGSSRLRLCPGSATTIATWAGMSGGYQSSLTRQRSYYNQGFFNTGAGLKNALKYFASAGNITNALLTLKGVV